jgi:hypothetical protein
MMQIVAWLPQDRRLVGALHLFGPRGGLIATGVPCLGKADGARAAAAHNPERRPVLPYGDTPAGTYKPALVEIFETWHPRMGRGCIPLEGEAGDALIAAQHGRTGLAIHAGRGDGGLVPTYGCLRLADSVFDRLVAAIGDEPVRVRVIDLE